MLKILGALVVVALIVFGALWVLDNLRLTGRSDSNDNHPSGE